MFYRPSPVRRYANANSPDAVLDLKGRAARGPLALNESFYFAPINLTGVRLVSRSIPPQWRSVGSISFGSPHVRPMGVHRTRGEPNEIKEKYPPGKVLSLRSFVQVANHDGGSVR